MVISYFEIEQRLLICPFDKFRLEFRLFAGIIERETHKNKNRLFVILKLGSSGYDSRLTSKRSCFKKERKKIKMETQESRTSYFLLRKFKFTKSFLQFS